MAEWVDFGVPPKNLIQREYEMKNRLNPLNFDRTRGYEWIDQSISQQLTGKTEDVMKIIEKVTYSIHNTKMVPLVKCGKSVQVLQ